MTPITVALKDEVAWIEEAVWIEDNLLAENPFIRYFTEGDIFLPLITYLNH